MMKLAIAALLVMPLGAGCLSQSNDAVPFEPQVRGFRATTGAEKPTGQLILEETATIVDRDGVSRRAYKLDAVGLSAGAPKSTFFLDALFRIVREDRNCAGSPDPECSRYVSYRWDSQGELAPFGIGLLNSFHAQSGLQVVQGRFLKEVPAKVEGATLTLGGEDSEYGSWYRSGRYVYRDSIMPSILPNQQVFELLEGPELPVADTWPISEAVSGGSWSGQLAPDQGQEMFNTGFTLQEFVQALHASSVSASAISSGCIAYALVQPGERSDYALRESITKVNFRIAHDAGQPFQEFQVTGTLGLLGKSFEVQRREDYQPQSTFSCSLQATMPQPQLGMAAGEALARAHAKGFSQLVIFKCDIDLRGTAHQFPPDQGWLLSQFVFRPMWVDNENEPASHYDLYTVGFDATTGWMTTALAAPNSF